MTGKRYVPIVIGVGDIKNKSTKIEDAIEPMQLMLSAIQLAIKDTNLSPSLAKQLQSSLDSVSVVATCTWNYPDLPGLVAERLGVKPTYKVLSHHGGDSPAKLFDEAARRISFGKSKVAIVTGGEALASLGACAAAGKLPPPGWTAPDESIPLVSLKNVSRKGENIGTNHSIGLPIHVYPLYENAFRAHRNQSIEENNAESAELYANFAKVAEQNPLAWNYGEKAKTAEEIRTVGKRNRMICFPYPLLMNAFNNINLAGACLLTSTEYARELGIPEDRWIYPLGGAGTEDNEQFWERPNYYSSPSISKSLDAGIQMSGLTKDEIDIFDFYSSVDGITPIRSISSDIYSCFPIVPKLACKHLGLPILSPEKPITLLGGLTSFGGAGNNYSMHALTEMVRQLRKGNGKTGLILANGGVITHQYVVCLSSTPRKTPYSDVNPLPEIITDWYVPPVDETANGEAWIETYTVEFNRDGTPDRGYVVGRLKKNGHRFMSNHGDEKTLAQLASPIRDPIGRSGWVATIEDGRNLFSFEASGKL